MKTSGLPSLQAELLLAPESARPGSFRSRRGIRDAETAGNVVWLPELYRLRAEASPDLSNRTASQADIESAIALAENQGAVTLVFGPAQTAHRPQRREKLT